MGGLVFKEDHEETVMKEDGSEEQKTINETAGIMAASTGDRPGVAAAGGLWIGGEKYTITVIDSHEAGETTIKCVQGMRPKKGVFIVSTASQFLIAMYSEEKGQCAPVCKKTALAFGEYRVGLGY